MRLLAVCAAIVLVGCGSEDSAPSAAGTGGAAGSGTAGTGATAGVAGTAGSGGAAGAAPLLCNRHAELCDRRFDEVAFPGTHNSMSNADEGWGVPNQVHGMTQQLADGIRVMLIDTHYDAGAAFLCHSFCSLGKKPLVDGLGEITAFMTANPNDVITLIIQDGITPEDTAKAFDDSGLVQFVHVHAGGSEWPTLREMIESGERLLVTAEGEGPPPDWYHHVWDLTWDTPYSFKSKEEFSCAENRGSKGNDLFLMNHWIENPLADPALSDVANSKDVLSARAEQCRSEGGQIPNFVAVNHYSSGALFEVVDELNGL